MFRLQGFDPLGGLLLPNPWHLIQAPAFLGFSPSEFYSPTGAVSLSRPCCSLAACLLGTEAPNPRVYRALLPRWSRTHHSSCYTVAGAVPLLGFTSLRLCSTAPPLLPSEPLPLGTSCDMPEDMDTVLEGFSGAAAFDL